MGMTITEKIIVLTPKRKSNSGELVQVNDWL